MGRLTLLGAGKPPVAAAGGGSWTSPLDASTPAIWWVDASNAASLTLSGGTPTKILEWADLGTGNHDMTAPIAGQEPTYEAGFINGKAAAGFGPSAALRTAVFTLAQRFMLVVAWRTGAAIPADYGILFDGDRDQVAVNRAAIFTKHLGGAAGNYAPYAGTLVSQGVAIAANTSYHSRVEFNGASSTSVLNASSLGPIGLNTGGIVNGIILGSNQGANAPAAGIGEAFIIPNPTAADHTNAAAYTLAKWGI